ncbi:MAG: HutD/Ves family protein [Steroidobacteraceae bacterium]
MSARAGAADALQVLRAAQCAAVPWKNGGGLTREVAVHPPGSDVARFDWRVSIAQIRTSGPFSGFPGVERCMAVLQGRLSLAIDEQAAVSLSPDSAPLAFSGEVPVFAAPQGGPVTDLNVMTRRGRCTSRLARCTVQESALLETHAGTTLLIAGSDLLVRCGAVELELGALDAALIGGGRRCMVISGHAAPYFHLVQIWSAGQPGG